MNNEKSKPNYFQTPKIMTDHPKITGDHIYIFMPLYDQLRQPPYDKIGYNKTNEYLSEFSKVGLRQTKTKLNELEEWGFLIRRGMGHNRKFFIGEIFNNSAKTVPVSSLNNRAESELEQGGKGTSTGRNRNYIAKNVIKNNTKKVFAYAGKSTSTPKPSYQEYHSVFHAKLFHGQIKEGTKIMSQEEFEAIQ